MHIAHKAETAAVAAASGHQALSTFDGVLLQCLSYMKPYVQRRIVKSCSMLLYAALTSAIPCLSACQADSRTKGIEYQNIKGHQPSHRTMCSQWHQKPMQKSESNSLLYLLDVLMIVWCHKLADQQQAYKSATQAGNH